MDIGSQQPAAVPARERIASLDFIRGIAVMGILCANIAAFGQPMSAAFYPGAFLTPASAGDGWLWLAQLVLIDGKMRGLFTVLFGAGLVLFVERAHERGAGVPLQLRRLFWLGCFGAAHYLLLWRGDILMSYAIAGALALMFVSWHGRNLLVLGLVAYVIGALVLTAAYALPDALTGGSFSGKSALAQMRTELDGAARGAMLEERVEAAAIQQGDYLAFVRGNAAALPGDLAASLLLIFLQTVPLVLIGMGLYRSGFFSGAVGPRRLLRWSAGGIAAGALATFLLGMHELRGGLTYYGTLSMIAGASSLPRLPMILGLAGLLMLLSAAAQGWLGDGIRAAGRAAFTNYIGTSFVMLWLFHGFGLGLFGELGRVQLYAVALAVALLMPLWSKAWLARYRYGPLEWLWRCLTYGRRFTLRQSVTE